MINQAIELSEKHIRKIIGILLCVMPVLGMAVDLVAPSLPAIARGLGISTSIAKNVISVYLLGYALGNFVTGFLTDAWGRKKFLIGGLTGFLISSLLPIFFPNIIILLVARFLQGATIGAVSVVARAVFSDVLPAEKLVRLGVLIGTMWGLGPVIGPIIGGYLQFYFGWQAGFGFFALISLALLIATLSIVPETHLNRHPLRLKTMKRNFLEVVSNRLFMALVTLMGLTYSILIVFNTAGPFIIQDKLHYSPVFFGHLALILGVVFLVSTLFSRHILKHFTTEQLLPVMIYLFFIFACLNVILSYFFMDSVILITLGSALVFFGTGCIFPMSMGRGISLFRHIAGTATATMYLINILITSFTSFLISLLNIHSSIGLMWMYFTLMLISTGVYWLKSARPG